MPRVNEHEFTEHQVHAILYSFLIRHEQPFMIAKRLYLNAKKVHLLCTDPHFNSLRRIWSQNNGTQTPQAS